MAIAILAGSEMVYFAMFDEIDEDTAIMKVSDNPPNSDKANFVNKDDVPSDHYLWLTGLVTKMLGEKLPLQTELLKRE